MYTVVEGIEQDIDSWMELVKRYFFFQLSIT